MSEQLNLPPFESLNDGDEITVRGVIRRDRVHPALVDVEFVWNFDECAGSITLLADEYESVALSVTRKAVAS